MLIKHKHVVMSRDQNAGRIHSIKIYNSSFERVERFKILCRKKLGADRSQEMLAIIRRSLLSSNLLPRIIKMKIYRSILLPDVLYRCETWSLTLRKEHRLRVFENRVLRRIFGSRKNEVTGGWRKLKKMRNLVVCTPHRISFG